MRTLSISALGNGDDFDYGVFTVSSDGIDIECIAKFKNNSDALIFLCAAQPRNAGDVAPMGDEEKSSGDLAQRA